MEPLEALVRAAQQGDDDAFARLVERFQAFAYATALRWLEQPQLAQDVAQEAFIDAYRCLPALREPRAFPSWLRRIVFKHADRQRRRRQPDALDDVEARRLVAATPGPEGMLEQWQRQQAVRAAIAALAPPYRQITTLFYLRERSYADIAGELDLPLSTVKKRLYMARLQLKERIVTMRPPTPNAAQNDTLTERVRFFLALKRGDLLQVGQSLRRLPALITAETEWGEGSDGWYWPLGNTALGWAAGTGDEPLAALLHEHGAPLDEPDARGQTPLVRAVQMGQAGMARWLLKHGADPNRRTAAGLRPLHLAVIQGRDALIPLLRDSGADAALTDDAGRTPLDWARQKGLPASARALGGDADPTARPGSSAPTDPAWETGLKIVDLLAPLRRGGRNGLFTPLSGIGFDVLVAELARRLAAVDGGRAVQVGLELGDFTTENRMLQWRNLAVDDVIEPFFAPDGSSPARAAHVAERAARRAVELADAGPVLLLVYTRLALMDGVPGALAPAIDHPAITLLFLGTESIGAGPPLLADLDAALTFALDRARQGLWPAIDPIRSYSNAFVDEAHRATATAARRLLLRCRDLQPIYENQGLAGFDNAFFEDDERHAIVRGRRLDRALTQLLFVAEAWTGAPGEFVPLARTLELARTVLAGEMDDVAEETLLFRTDWSPRWT